MLIEFEKGLAKAAIEAGTGEIRTRNGSLVKVVDWNSKEHPKYPIVGVLDRWKDNNTLFHWSNEGVFDVENGTGKFDLVIVDLTENDTSMPSYDLFIAGLC